MKRIFDILSWCYVVFAILMCLGTDSLPASIILICSAIIAFPVKFMINGWEKISKKHVVWIKPLVIFIVFCFAICITPNTQVGNPGNENYNSDMGVVENETHKFVTKAPKVEEIEPVTKAPKIEETEPVTEAPKAEETNTATEAPETSKAETSVKDETTKGITYTLNTNSKKFHYVSCVSARKIKSSNKDTYTGKREDLILLGYSPCGNCDP